MYLGPDQISMNELLAKICKGFSGTTTYISNYGQASAVKAAYIFKVFGAQSCLMAA